MVSLALVLPLALPFHPGLSPPRLRGDFVRPRFESLQAVRGAACLLVWGLHLALWEQCFGIARPVLAPLLRFGFGGVDLFFVLSGVLIAHTQGHHAGRPAAVPGYLLRRGWRVFPAYWVVFALALAGTGWGFGQRHAAPDGSPAPWAHWALLLPHAAPNTVLFCSWTLCYEVLFYAAFAAVLLLPRGWGGGTAGTLGRGRGVGGRVGARPAGRQRPAPPPPQPVRVGVPPGVRRGVAVEAGREPLGLVGGGRGDGVGNGRGARGVERGQPLRVGGERTAAGGGVRAGGGAGGVRAGGGRGARSEVLAVGCGRPATPAIPFTCGTCRPGRWCSTSPPLGRTRWACTCSGSCS